MKCEICYQGEMEYDIHLCCNKCGTPIPKGDIVVVDKEIYECLIDNFDHDYVELMAPYKPRYQKALDMYKRLIEK